MKNTGLNSWKSWGIAVMCSFVNLICFLPLRLTGLVFLALMERYNISRKAASRPLVVSTMVRCGIGPLIGYLCGIFECRTIVTWGVILSSLGVGACYLAEEITYVIVSLGVIYGVGIAAASFVIPLVIKQYFDQHASKANGLSFVGSTLSAIIVPSLFEYLYIQYGTAGVFLLTSGIMLNGIPAAILLKNPNYARTAQTKNELKEENSSSNANLELFSNGAPIMHEMRKFVTAKSLVNFTHETSEVCDHTNVLSSLKNLNKEDIMFQQNELSINDQFLSGAIDAVYNKCEERTESQKYENCDIIGEEIYPLGLPQLKLSCNKIKKRKALCSSLKVFKDPSYLIILFTQGVHICLVLTVWTIIVDLSRDKGIPNSQEDYFLMLYPVGELFGLISLAWVTDGGYISASNFLVVVYACTAISCGGLVWSFEFVTMLIALLSFSFFTSSIAMITPALIYEFIDEKENAMAMASRFLLFPPMGLTIPLLIGYFRETLGSYDWLLYVLAITSLFCSFLFVLMPYTALYKNRKRKLSLI